MDKSFKKISEITGPDGPNDSYVVLGTWGRYTLIARNATYQPWVVAAGYDPEGGCWDAGEYFSDLLYATLYILKKVNEEALIESVNEIAGYYGMDDLTDMLAGLQKEIKAA